MAIEITCRRCGATYVPTREAIVGGVWRTCPDCRPVETDKQEPGGHPDGAHIR